MKLLIIQPKVILKYETEQALAERIKQQIRYDGFLILNPTKYDYAVEEVDGISVEEEV